jgi:hypothetical protein
LSFAVFLYPKRKKQDSRFSWVEPLKPTIWSLFDIGLFTRGENWQISASVRGYGPSFDTFLTLLLTQLSSCPVRGSEYEGLAVISHDEIRIYQDRALRNCTAMVRAKGKWVVGSVG